MKTLVTIRTNWFANGNEYASRLLLGFRYLLQRGADPRNHRYVFMADNVVATMRCSVPLSVPCRFSVITERRNTVCRFRCRSLVVLSINDFLERRNGTTGNGLRTNPGETERCVGLHNSYDAEHFPASLCSGMVGETFTGFRLDWWDLKRIGQERPYYDTLCASYPTLEQQDACRRQYYSAKHLNWWDVMHDIYG